MFRKLRLCCLLAAGTTEHSRHDTRVDKQGYETVTDNNIFVLGVGAQKAGTTWLYSYIDRVACANMGFQKEYHIWDAVYSDLCSAFVVPRKKLPQLPRDAHMRFCMQNLPGFYESYFKDIFDNGFSITGDITPSYAVLTRSQLQRIRKRVLSTGAKVRCVYLMRDPVERCWSAVRMQLRKNQIAGSEENALARLYATPQYQFRTRYERVCENLKNVFPENELFFGFYENLFTDEEITRLSNFIGVDPFLDQKEKRVNVSAKSSVISPSLFAKVREFYSETYRYCNKNFPRGTALWN